MRALVISGLVFVSACSLGALDGFSGGAEPADAAADTGSTDATSDADGNVSADSGGDAGAKRFCESLSKPPRACVDFDDGDLPLAFTREEGAGGSVHLLPSEGRDGTGGLASIVTANADSSASACILITLPGPRTSITVEADFRVEVVGTDNYDLLNLDTAGNRELGVSVTGTKILIEEDYPADAGFVGNGEGYRFGSTTAVAKNTWQRLRFAASVGGNGGASAELFVDGATMGTLSGIVASTVAETTKFEVGDCTLVGAKGWKVYLDNVVVYETN